MLSAESRFCQEVSRLGVYYKLMPVAIVTTAECQELSSCPPCKVRENKSNFDPKKNYDKFKSINMVKQNVAMGVFRHNESKSVLYSALLYFL